MDGRRILSYVLTVVLAYAAWMGIVEGQTWAWGVTTFQIWVSFVFALLIVVTYVRSGAKATKARSIPVWIAVPYDMYLILLCASFGHYGWASMILFAAIAESVFFDEFDNPREVTNE